MDGNKEKLPTVRFQDELHKLRYTIKKFKAYDSERKKYIAGLLNEMERKDERIRQLEALTERQHADIDEMLDAYANAGPLIAEPKKKAFLYELVRRSKESTSLRKRLAKITEQAEWLETERSRLMGVERSLREQLSAMREPG